MTKKPIIGIVSKPNTFVNGTWSQQIVYDGLRCAVLKNGGLAIGILPSAATHDFNKVDGITDTTSLSAQEIEDLKTLVDMCDGIILSGGLSATSYERKVANIAIDKDIPLLGVCSGFNNIVRACGGETFLLGADNPHNRDGENYVHDNKIIKGTKLHDILGSDNVKVNSIHTVLAKIEDIKELAISALSDDGYVEAVEMPNRKFVLGVKWHPELMLRYDKKMNKIFAAFIKACYH